MIAGDTFLLRAIHFLDPGAGAGSVLKEFASL